MKPAGAHTLFVIDDDAAVRVAVQGCATQRWTQLRSRGAGLKNHWPSPTRLEQLFHRPGSMRARLLHEGAAPASVPQPHLPANPLEQYSVRRPRPEVTTSGAGSHSKRNSGESDIWLLERSLPVLRLCDCNRPLYRSVGSQWTQKLSGVAQCVAGQLRQSIPCDSS
jgi:hypothetical protein